MTTGKGVGNESPKAIVKGTAMAVLEKYRRD
jgi:hypothetical protein